MDGKYDILSRHSISMILITGSSGQVGSYLVEELENSIGLDKRESKYTKIVHDLVKNPDKVLKNYEIDKIVHCAAQVSVKKSIENPEYDARNNIMGAINLLEYARKRDVEKFIYISSAAVYGEPRYLPIDEEHPTEPKSPYGLSKLSGEKYSLLYSQLYGLNVVSIRPFNIFSPRQDPNNPYSGVISIFVNRAKRNLPLIIYGDGTQTRDFVNIEDVIQMVKLSLKKDVRGIYNCGTGRKISINELANIIKEISGKNIKIIYDKPREGDIRFSYASIEKARKIGYKPRTNIRKDLKRYFFEH